MRLEDGLLSRIAAFKSLPEADRDLLCSRLKISYGHAQAALPELSIFAKRPDPQILDGVKSYFYPGRIFYIPLVGKSNAGFFVDDKGKLLYNSRFYFTHLNGLIDNIEHALRFMSRIDFSKFVDIGSNIYAVEKWYITYGHYKDEAFNLGHYLDEPRLPKNGEERALLDYPTDDGLDSNAFHYNLNYQLIDRLIFESRSINAYSIDTRLIGLRRLRLFENGFDSAGFHRFPEPVTRKIRAKVTGTWKGGRIAKLFLSRGASYRDIANKEETEQHFRDRGYTVLNPEDFSYAELVDLAQHVEKVAMYYGSALTNMVYFPRGASVFILKAESYMEEKLDLWSKVIGQYELKVSVINAVENRIPLGEVDGYGI